VSPPGITRDDYQRQLDHIDTMIHDCRRILTALEPLLPLADQAPRLIALLDPFAKVRSKGKRGRPDAFPVSPATPLHVGAASADRRTVDTQVWE